MGADSGHGRSQRSSHGSSRAHPHHTLSESSYFARTSDNCFPGLRLPRPAREIRATSQNACCLWAMVGKSLIPPGISGFACLSLSGELTGTAKALSLPRRSIEGGSRSAASVGPDPPAENRLRPGVREGRICRGRDVSPTPECALGEQVDDLPPAARPSHLLLR